MKKLVLVIVVVYLIFLSACATNNMLSETIYEIHDENSISLYDYSLSDNNFEDFSTEKYDYSYYLKKTWVIRGINDFMPSIYITNIDNGIVEGKWSLHPILPDCYVNSFESLEYGTIKGIISNGEAQCKFDDVSGSGIIKLIFKENSIIEANIEFTNKEYIDKEYPNGNYIFYPYSISDLSVLTDKKIYPIELEYWGKVNIITGYITAHHPYAVAYLTDSDDNILYRFKGLTNGVKVTEVVIEDMNDDGLSDIKIILGMSGVKTRVEYIFIQMENGLFYNSKLNSNFNNQ